MLVIKAQAEIILVSQTQTVSYKYIVTTRRDKEYSECMIRGDGFC